MARSTVKWFGDKVKKKMRERQSLAIRKSAVFLERKIKLSMKRGTGNVYTVGGKTVRRSVAGQPPAVDLGRLRASITFQTSDGHGSTPQGDRAQAGDGVGKPTAIGLTEVVAIVGTNVDYGRHLELGTPRMKPRPFLRIALENNRTQILKFFDFGGR